MQKALCLVAAAVASVVSTLSAGTFTTITVDGDMADWASVPVLVTDPSGDGSPIDVGAVQMANDADNLYLRISYVTPVNPNIGPSIFLAFDTDSNVATGFNIYGLNTVGSDAGFQNDFPFDQRTGFNVGSLTAAATISPIDWGDPSNVFSSQEYSIPRNLAYSTDSAAVFANPGFNLMLWTDSSTAVDVTSAIPYLFASPVVDATWAVGGGGAWSTASNWNPAAVPNDLTTPVRFGGVITAPATVTVDGDYSVAAITFDSATSYTLSRSAATSSLTAAGAVTVSSGSHTLAVDTKAASLDLSATGVGLNVSNASVAIDYIGAGSSYDQLAALVIAGKLTSTVGSSTRTVGLVEAADLGVTTFGDLSVDSTAVLMRGTFAGDTDLNLVVNFDDLLSLAQAYGLSDQSWINGDSNYDGTVDFEDLLALAQSYGMSGLSTAQVSLLDAAADGSFLADWNLALSVLPEPSSMTLVAIACTVTRRRRYA